MKRQKNKQSAHDSRVKRVAGGYKGKGWKVKADIPGYSRPRPIHGRRPDVVATKGQKTRIVEVETKSSMRKDVPQRNAFRKFANSSKKRKFRTSVI